MAEVMGYLYNDEDNIWPGIHELVLWLDDGKARSPQEILLRALKLQEEAGELAEAIINVSGQNPRKPKTKTLEDVAAEAVDCAVTALVFLETISPNNDTARRFFNGRLEYLRDRIKK